MSEFPLTTMSTTTTPSAGGNIHTEKSFWIGVLMAVGSSIFIGSSFIIKKIALIHLNRSGGLRAGAGGFGYLKEWIWWAGLITMGVGEVLNFTAYTFAPASLVTPLGALSVIVSAVLSSIILKERLNIIGKLGCGLCILGSIVIVIHAPMTAEVKNLKEFLHNLTNTAFIVYVCVVIALALIIAIFLGPRYGTKCVYVPISVCALIGSLTVMSCKGLGLAIVETIDGKSDDFHHWLPYILLIVTVVFIVIQMDYLNKALDVFNTGIVTPIYYVSFTTLVIISSAILFREWSSMSTENIIGEVCGFLIVIIAVILLSAFQNLDVQMDHMSSLMQPKRPPATLSTTGANLPPKSGGAAHLEQVMVRHNFKDNSIGFRYGTAHNPNREL